MRRALIIVMAGAVTACAAGTGSAANTPPSTSPPHLLATACPASVATVPKVRCLRLVVPERRHPAGRGHVRLFVTILPSRTAPAREPVLVLQGGPGDTPDPSAFVDHPLRDGHEVIILDQRGTGRSRPSLACPELSAVSYAALGEDPHDRATADAIVGAAAACHDRLARAGIDLAAYNTAENAADVADLRRALHLATWDLVGNSYGSRLALTVLRRDGRGVHAVGLSGVYPTDVNTLTEIADSTADAFDALFAPHPGLRATFVALVQRLEQHPVRVTATTADGRRLSILFDGDNLVGLVRQALYTTNLIPSLPTLIEQLAAGREFDTTAKLVAEQAPGLLDASKVSLGMYFSVQCQEDFPRVDVARVRAAVTRYPSLDSVTGLVYPYARICARWRVGRQPAATRRPVRSRVPVVMFTGALDPATPPAWARHAARTLVHGYAFILPGYGHDTTALPCPRTVRNAFFADPSVVPADACLRQPPQP